jgi:hypothetical protein
MKKYFLILLVILFTGCSYKTTPVEVAFKKDNFAINDQGFLKENAFAKRIEVYQAGNLAFVFTIKSNSICINNKCYDKNMFIYQLNPNYPTNLFETIIAHKPFKNIKIIKTENGFAQVTKDFIYKINKNFSLFKDKHKHFLFLVKKILKKKQKP